MDETAPNTSRVFKLQHIFDAKDKCFKVQANFPTRRRATMVNFWKRGSSFRVNVRDATRFNAIEAIVTCAVLRPRYQ